MRWFRLRYVTVVLCLLLIALMGSAVLYGRTLAIPAFGRFEAAGFDICQGKFCLFEITPGVTTWQEAMQTLAEHVTRDEGDHFHGRVGAAEIRVAIGATGSQIGAIEVQATARNQDALALRFGQIIEHFWIPCTVTSSTRREDSLVLTYPSFRIQVLADQGYLSLDSPISAITLLEHNNLDVENNSCSEVQGGLPWRGLASVKTYRTLRASGFELR